MEKFVDHLLSRDEVCDVLKISSRTLSRWLECIGFPDPIRINARKQLWRKSDIDEWFEDQSRLNREGLTRVKIFEKEYQCTDDFWEIDQDWNNEVMLSKELPEEPRGRLRVLVVYEGDDV